MNRKFDQLPVTGLIIELTDDGRYDEIRIEYDRWRRMWHAKYVRALTVSHPGEAPAEQEETVVVSLVSHTTKKTLEAANAILERLQQHSLVANCDIERMWVERALSVGNHHGERIVEVEPGLYCNSWAIAEDLHLPAQDRTPVEGRPLEWFRSRTRSQLDRMRYSKRKRKKAAPEAAPETEERQGEA